VSTFGKIEGDAEEELKSAIIDFNKTFVKESEAVIEKNN
jgi:hypothetical protein